MIIPSSRMVCVISRSLTLQLYLQLRHNTYQIKSDFEILLGCKNPPKQFPLPTTNYGPNRLVIANNVAIHSPYRIPRLDCDCKLPTSSSSSSSRRRSAFHSIRKRRAAMKNIENRFLWTLHLPAAAVAMDGNFAVTTTRSWSTLTPNDYKITAPFTPFANDDYVLIN